MLDEDIQKMEVDVIFVPSFKRRKSNKLNFSCKLL